MPRRKVSIKREVIVDEKYNSLLLTKFINKTMFDGKKSIARNAVYKALDILAKKTGKKQLEAFKDSIRNIIPEIEVKSRRVGGATYQVPVEVNQNRAEALAMKWVITYARLRNEKTIGEKLAGELLDASNNTGASIKKKDDTHRMAEANKAFASYRW